MKDKRKIIIQIVKIIIIVGVFLFLITPSINPFLTDEMKKELSLALQGYFGIVSNENTTPVFSLTNIISVVVVALFVYLVSKLICFIIEKICAGRKRSKTVAGLIISLIKTLSAIVSIVWILSILGVNLTTIFASLGVISLIIGFGVQSLIEDCVTGIFLIIEGQFNIGDIIVLGDFRGTVIKITIRTTSIQDDGGNIKIINNSDIRNIQNRSNKISIAGTEIGISYSENLERVEQLLNEAFPQMYENNKDVFEDAPKYLGVQSLGASAVILKVVVQTKESSVFGATRRLNRELKLLFDKNNIEIPFNQLVVHNLNCK